MNFAGWTQRHRSSLLFLIAVLVVGGVAEIRNLPVALFPYISFPRVVVSLDAGDRPAERMMIEVTLPIEQAVSPRLCRGFGETHVYPKSDATFKPPAEPGADGLFANGSWPR